MVMRYDEETDVLSIGAAPKIVSSGTPAINRPGSIPLAPPNLALAAAIPQLPQAEVPSSSSQVPRFSGGLPSFAGPATAKAPPTSFQPPISQGVIPSFSGGNPTVPIPQPAQKAPQPTAKPVAKPRPSPTKETPTPNKKNKPAAEKLNATPVGEYGRKSVYRGAGEQGEPAFFAGPPIKQPTSKTPSRDTGSFSEVSPTGKPSTGDLQKDIARNVQFFDSQTAAIRDLRNARREAQGLPPVGERRATGPVVSSSEGYMRDLERRNAQVGVDPPAVAATRAANRLRGFPSFGGGRAAYAGLVGDQARAAVTARGQDIAAQTAADQTAIKQQQLDVDQAKIEQAMQEARSEGRFKEAELNISQANALANQLKAKQGNLKTEVYSDPMTGFPLGIITLDAKDPAGEPRFISFEAAKAMASGDSSGLSQEQKSQLKEGEATTFGNDQTWTLKDGKPVRVG